MKKNTVAMLALLIAIVVALGFATKIGLERTAEEAVVLPTSEPVYELPSCADVPEYTCMVDEETVRVMPEEAESPSTQPYEEKLVLPTLPAPVEVPQHIPAPVVDAVKEPSVPPCVHEDGPGPCFWDATTRGNGEGMSFYLSEDQTFAYGGPVFDLIAAEYGH